jgi:hypothetical protein
MQRADGAGRASRAQISSQFLQGASPAGEALRIGVLLIHGLNGNPSDLAELASMLQTHGMITTTMRLPGHGEQGCERRPVRWQEWVSAVRREVHRLSAYPNNLAVLKCGIQPMLLTPLTMAVLCFIIVPYSTIRK